MVFTEEDVRIWRKKTYNVTNYIGPRVTFSTSWKIPLECFSILVMSQREQLLFVMSLAPLPHSRTC